MNIGEAYVSLMADLNPMRASVKQAKAEAGTFVSETSATVEKGLTAAWKKVGDISASAWGKMRSEATTAAGGIASSVESKSGSMLSAFKKLGAGFSQIWTDGSKTAQKEIAQVEKSVDGLHNRFSGLRDMLRGVFQGAGMAAFNAAMSAVGGVVHGVSDALFGLNNEAEAASAKINAFTKDANITAEVMAAVRKEAAATPFAFQEMANATAALMPVAKQAGKSWEDLLKQAEILAASNPMQGLEGASFALREAMGGDFTSIIERFNLSRSSINQWKEEGVDNMEIVRRAMLEMGYDSDLVGAMALTMSGRWSTLMDSLDGFKIALTKPTFDFLKIVLGDTQTLIDGNTERWTKLAEAAGQKFADGLSAGFTAIKEAIRFINLLRDALNGTQSAGESLAKATWADRWAGNIIETVAIVKGTFQELADAINGQFSGMQGGMLYEDSPLILGLMKAHDLASDTADAFDRMAQKAGAVKLPEQAGGGTVGSAVGDTLGKVDLGAVGIGAGAAGAAMGLVALLPLLGHITPLITPLLSILPVLGTVLGALVSPIGLLAGAVALLAVAWVNNWGDIQGKTEEVVTAVSGFLDANLPGVLENLRLIWNDVWSSIKQTAADFMAAVMPLLSRFLDYWTNDLQPQLAALGAVIVPALEEMGAAISRTFNAILPYVLSFVESVKNLGAAVLPILLEVAGYIVDSFGPAISRVVSYLTEVIPLFAKAFDNVLRLVTPILQGIIAIVTTVFNAIAGFIQQNSDTITAVLKAAWDLITGIVRIAWDILTGIVKAGLTLLSGDWRGAWEEIKQTLFNVWEDLKRIASAAWELLKGGLELGLTAIKDIWNKAWEWIRDRLSQLSGEMRTKLDEWSTGLKTLLDNAATGLKNAVLKPWEDARDAIGGVMTAFKDKLLGPLRDARNGLNTFFTGVANLINKVSGFFGIQITITPPELPQFANGLNPGGWGGGYAWVGEGQDGRASGAELAYLPQGSRVIPHAQSMAMVRQGLVAPPGPSSPVPGFAFGLGLDDIPGLGGLMGLLGKGAEEIVNLAIKALGTKGPELPGVLSGAGAALFDKVKGWLIDAVTGWKKDLAPNLSLAKAMEFALSQLGKPYQWGGDGNPSYDCSGFAAAVAGAAGVRDGMPRVVYDIFNWVTGGKHPLFTFGFNNPTNPDPRVQHMGVGIMGQHGMEWFEAGGRAGGIGRTDDYWQTYGFPPGLDAKLAASAAGPGGSAPWNSQAPATVVNWLLSGLAAGGQPSSWLSGADIIAFYESNYTPTAVNATPVGGEHASGLMQTLPSTFLANAVAGMGDIFNPVHNVAAASRYIRGRYSEMGNVPGVASIMGGGPYKPYANGGVITEPVTGVGLYSGINYLMGEMGREYVLTPEQLESLYQYFFVALSTGRVSNEVLTKFPLELRAPLMKAAQGYLDRLSETGSGLPEGNTSAGAGVGGLTAAEQIYMARTYGTFYPGVLTESDPAITAALAEYSRKQQGVDNTAGPSSGTLPDAAPTLPSPAAAGIPDTTPSSGRPAGAGGGGGATISLQLTNRFEMPDGQVIVQTIVTDPVALSDLTEGVTEVQAREISKRTEPGGRLGVPPPQPKGLPKPIGTF